MRRNADLPGSKFQNTFGSSFQCLGLWFTMVHSSSHITNLHCHYCQNSTCFQKQLGKRWKRLSEATSSLGKKFHQGKMEKSFRKSPPEAWPSYRSCGISMAKTSKDHAGVGKGTTTCGRPSLDISSANSANRNMKGYKSIVYKFDVPNQSCCSLDALVFSCIFPHFVL